jgi:hypothetical protein
MINVISKSWQLAAVANISLSLLALLELTEAEDSINKFVEALVMKKKKHADNDGDDDQQTSNYNFFLFALALC